MHALERQQEAARAGGGEPRRQGEGEAEELARLWGWSLPDPDFPKYDDISCYSI